MATFPLQVYTPGPGTYGGTNYSSFSKAKAVGFPESMRPGLWGAAPDSPGPASSTTQSSLSPKAAARCGPPRLTLLAAVPKASGPTGESLLHNVRGLEHRTSDSGRSCPLGSSLSGEQEGHVHDQTIMYPLLPHMRRFSCKERMERAASNASVWTPGPGAYAGDKVSPNVLL